MSGIVAQANTDDGDVGIFDNKILDEYEVPFGEWIEHIVDWVDQNAGGVLDVIRWPFSFLLENVVDNFFADVSWVWICLLTLVVGALVRNIRIGVSAAAALAICGLLGTNYWEETARTIGMILVAVALCALVGIPLGVLCGRIDGVWNVVRPILDAMQVVHAFVYMLPVIFFFSFGVVPGTMVTMIFALPPLIRLTNLGIRQVPEDVVEASRAYGAPEMRVLFDVQLPLARPAIMTGLNQTLLLAISMIGIAAIMGAGGLGLLVFRAVQNLDISLAASAGLALFMVAVVLDRISQPEESDGGSLFSRISNAWAHRKDPSPLLDTDDEVQPVASTRSTGSYAPITGAERTGMAVAGAGAVIAIVSTFLTWANDGGLVSGWARRVDQLELTGRSFDGIDASGGSWFGYLVLLGALFILVSMAFEYLRPGRNARWLSSEGALFAAGMMLFTTVGYLVMQGAEIVRDEYSHGTGVYVALVGSVIAAIGSFLWLQAAPYQPFRPFAAKVSWGRLFGGTVAVGLLVISLWSGWSFDERADTVISPELQAQIDELRAQAAAGEIAANVAAQQIQNLSNSAQLGELIVLDGITSDGAQLGWPVLILGLASLALLLPASGLFFIDEKRQRTWGALSAALGVGIIGICAAWVISILRVADSEFVSGAGVFLALLGGFFLLVASRTTLAEYRRVKVYGDAQATTPPVIDLSPVDETELVPS